MLNGKVNLMQGVYGNGRVACRSGREGKETSITAKNSADFLAFGVTSIS